MPTAGVKGNPLPRVLSASTLAGDRVVNSAGEDLGKIEELMIDLQSGRVAYAVLSFGGFLGMGDKLFAIPWSALAVDTVEKRLVLNVSKELLKQAPGFNKANWPNMADPAWGADLQLLRLQAVLELNPGGRRRLTGNERRAGQSHALAVARQCIPFSCT